MEKLSIDPGGRAVEHSLDSWIEFIERLKSPREEIEVALVGKYVEHQDAYKSISESFVLAGVANNVSVKIRYILSDDLSEENVQEKLSDVLGVLVAPGFGERGIEGKLAAVRFARENDLPFLGICLGMQCAIIEYARNVVGWADAHSKEFSEETLHPVIDLMEEQKKVVLKGGTMRLGGYDCHIRKGTKAYEIYEVEQVKERHRHRYEVNNAFRDDLESHGLQISGLNQASDLVEIIELPEKRWFVGVQFHPEYRSVVDKPHPLFESFVGAIVVYYKERKNKQVTNGSAIKPETVSSSGI